MVEEADELAAAAFQGRYRGKKVLLTGHTGFKGAWLTEWLLMLGAQVTGISLDPPTAPSLFEQLDLGSRMKDLRIDIRDCGKLTEVVAAERPEIVFHLAAQSLVRYSYTSPVETFATNVLGSVNLLEAVRVSGRPCAVVMVTTDKCYENREWVHPYREDDRMGGYDPYSASKGAAEIAIGAYRRSFFPLSAKGRQVVALASARAGNVLGGGDWAADRILPDCIRALQARQPVVVRNKTATRPWQHVLEPLSGYLLLGAVLQHSAAIGDMIALERLCSAFNFGPTLDANRSVASLVAEVFKTWPGEWSDQADPKAPHEATRLNLAIDKAFHLLNWRPVWTFTETVHQTVRWYQAMNSPRGPEDTEVISFTRAQIVGYCRAAQKIELPWIHN